MQKQGEFLKIRAEKFFKNGENLMKEGDYDIAAFSFEQAGQLFLKYYLFSQVGTYPFSHSLQELLVEISKIYPQKEEIKKILEQDKEIILDLEEAYISSRYLPVNFLESQVQRMKNFVIKLKNLILNE